MKNSLLVSLLICLTGLVHAQSITGVVVDVSNDEPIPGASVYYDGTTIGTATDVNGKFDLLPIESSGSMVIISFVGYESQMFSAGELRNQDLVKLKPATTVMDELVFQEDNWSRSKKMRIFKQEFLGKTFAAQYCKIVNHKDLRLVYDPVREELLAFCEQPIVVKNRYLGYEVRYNLSSFVVSFETDVNDVQFISEVYYAGSSFFSELEKQPKKRHLENRKKAYGGSRLHFMRALAARQLTENKFDIFFQGFPVQPYAYLTIEQQGDARVNMSRRQLSVLYNRDQQSMIELDGPDDHFYIDNFGIFYPVQSVKFAGAFGSQRIANMLPQDYGL